MAVLQNIRNKAGLLIGIIAFALLAFLLGDLLKSGSIGSPDRTIAEINGKDIAVDDYQIRLNELTEVYKMNSGQATLDQATSERVQDETWNALVRDEIMSEEYASTGVSVNEDELFDMIQGDNIHPMIRQIFANPQTGQVDKAQILNFLKSFDMEGGAQREAYWLFIEKELRRQRMNEKYNTLLTKGIVVNSAEAKLNIEGSATNKNVDFFSVAYSTISDSTITVSSSDMSAYYNAHKENYKQKETRGVEYISLDIVPSSADDKEVSEWSKNVAKELADDKELANEKELVRYVKFSSDKTWDEKYLAETEVEARLKEFAFAQEVGAVYGPYKNGNAYEVVKLASREMRSDSVQASHILIQEATAERTAELADSLFEVLAANKGKMAQLAKDYSKDQGSAAKGGDLGWFKDGAMVPTFNTAAFEGKIGDVQKVTSNFGTHIIIVTEKSEAVEKVQLAKITRDVTASNETYRDIYAEASLVRSASTDYTSFKAAAAEKGLRVRYGSNITPDSKTVMGLQDSKDLVRWAYKAEQGDISEVIELDGLFIVATLTKVTEKGYKPQSEVANIVKAAVIKDKKAEMIAADINSKSADSKSITSLASKMNTSIKTASNINFGSYSVPQAGVEPNLVGAISNAKVNEISAPVTGSRGVYVFNVTSEAPNATARTIEAEKEALAQQKTYMINYQAFNALQEGANVVDNRLRYY